MRERTIWIWGAVAVLVVMLAVAGLRGIGSAPTREPTAVPRTTSPSQSKAPSSGQASDAVVVSIASSNTKQDWLHQAVRAFNEASRANKDLQLNGRPVSVEIIQETVDGKLVDYRSGTMVSDTLLGKIKPTVVSPGEESWLVKLKKEWQALNGKAITTGEAPVLVRTPLVIAMWQSRARALGCWPTVGTDCTWARIRALATSPTGWGMFGQPAWRKFKLGYGYFGESNSGTLGVLAMCMVGAGKRSGLAMADVDIPTGCGEMIAAVEKAKVHSGKSDIWLLERMTGGGPEYLDAVITYESNVISLNRAQGQNLREPLVAVYPQDGTVVVGHPFAVLDGAPWVTPEQAAAARVFQKYLLSPDQQAAVLSLGLRPADASVKLGSPIEPGNGANPQASLVTLELPDTLVIDRVGEVWHKVRKHAIIALVFDKSGSMRGTKISAAIAGAREFIARMDGEDWLIWMPFDSTVYAGSQGLKSQLAEKLVDDVVATTAGGGTALYDAILLGVDRLEAERKVRGDSARYGLVVLSDGRDENSKKTLSMVEATLKPTENDPTGIQIHTIAIGTDADEMVLRKIANAAHGRFWKGQTASDMVTVYKDIAAHY